ncbi:carbohydrate ABC transporter permease [Herbiconiux sp. L3-i23]|uniref:carbohydrate ABC transporter permease n=1 Tax=Herbiconiux sp. L3-i23 TaxID=2905871 RepID=UPI0020474FAA|nr:carbohydrate ABC transporter permease [Herbiconiux sp. L3-i23]BDI22178.1 sugar ABC transporter permease [Herbiconiux sp. L3-i23]
MTSMLERPVDLDGMRRGATGDSPAKRRLSRRSILGGIARHSLLIALLIVFLAPLFFIVTTALMTDQQALTSNLIPDPINWANFAEVFDRIPLVRYVANTVLIAVATTVFAIVSSVPVAYALATFKFKGRRALWIAIIAAMMLPPQVTIVPLYVMWAQVGAVGTPLPLIVPALFGDAFTIFLLRQFFVSVPRSYIDAARIDGAGEFRILWSVFMPMVRPAIVAAGLFAFFFAWNDFFNPLLYLGSNQEWYTLSIGLSQFRSVYAVQWNLAMAATLLFVLPVVVLFFFAQKQFVQGIALTGVKE